MIRAPLLFVGGLVACTANAPPVERNADGGVSSSSVSGRGSAGEPEVDESGGSEAEVGGAAAAASEGGAAHGGAAQGGADFMAGGAGQDGCDRDAVLDPLPRARGVALHQLAVFQAVKVSIMELGFEVSPRKTSLISGRPALLRAYVEPRADWAPRVIRARLTLSYPLAGMGPQVLEQTRRIEQPSTDAQLTSTFNFSLSAELMTEDMQYSIELLETDPCAATTSDVAGARFPETLELAMSPTPETKLQVLIVPLVHEAGDVTLMPDTSAEQIELFRRKLLRLFPLSQVELSVRAQPLATTAQTMVEALDQVAALRDEEAPAANLAYYGIVRLRETREQYCNPSCVLGASLNGEVAATGASVGVGVGVGYSGEEAATTIAHELGHVYGRPHSPCGVSGDAAFPYSNGRIGSWGYDVESKTLFDPFGFSDFMGYCSPSWVSDHTYERLREFLVAVDPPPATARGLRLEPATTPQNYRTLLLTPDAAPIWGTPRKLRRAPAAPPEDVHVFAADDRSPPSTATIFRRHVTDTSTDILYVPEWVYENGASLGMKRGRLALPARRATERKIMEQ